MKLEILYAVINMLVTDVGLLCLVVILIKNVGNHLEY